MKNKTKLALGDESFLNQLIKNNYQARHNNNNKKNNEFPILSDHTELCSTFKKQLNKMLERNQKKSLQLK